MLVLPYYVPPPFGTYAGIYRDSIYIYGAKEPQGVKASAFCHNEPNMFPVSSDYRIWVTSKNIQHASYPKCHTDTFEPRLVAHNGRLRGSLREKFPGPDPPPARGYSAASRRSRTVACDSG